jgi:hypothetical protein
MNDTRVLFQLQDELDNVRRQLAAVKSSLEQAQIQSSCTLAFILAECDVAIGDPVEFCPDDGLADRALWAVQELRKAVIAMAN